MTTDTSLLHCAEVAGRAYAKYCAVPTWPLLEEPTLYQRYYSESLFIDVSIDALSDETLDKAMCELAGHFDFSRYYRLPEKCGPGCDVTLAEAGGISLRVTRLVGQSFLTFGVSGVPIDSERFRSYMREKHEQHMKDWSYYTSLAGVSEPKP